MKIFVYTAITLSTLMTLGGIYWISRCINLETVTFGDSEAAYRKNELIQRGKHQQKQEAICTIVDIPLHMRKFD